MRHNEFTFLLINQIERWEDVILVHVGANAVILTAESVVKILEVATVVAAVSFY